jgi:hypothetical protein
MNSAKNSSFIYHTKKPSEPHQTEQLFSEDLCFTGAKQFFFSSYENIYNTIKSNKENYYNEDNTFNNKIKLFLDIDDKEKEFSNELEQDKFIQNYLNDLLYKMNIYIYQKFKKNDPKVIILKSKTLKKFSLHIIYPEIVFDNIAKMKIFMNEIDFYGIDLNPYKIGCFRMLYCSKKGKNNQLVLFTYRNYNYENDKQLFLDSCICYVLPEIKPVEYKLDVKIKQYVSNKPYLSKPNYYYHKINFDKIEEMLEKLNDYNKDYNDWLLIAFGMKDLYLGSNTTNKNKIYDLFDNFSSKSDNYNKEQNKNIFMRINPFENNINLLFKKANMDYFISSIYNDYEKDLFDENKYENIIKINKKHITSQDDNIEDYLEKLLENDVIYIKSPTGTGKTTLTKKLKSMFGDSIISITSRVNLAGEHMKHLNLDFYKLMTREQIYNSNKLVIQLESLSKCNYTNFIGETVLLDETSSIMSHFRSTTMVNRRGESYMYFIELIKNAGKVICLDADLCNWNIEFISKIRKDKFGILYNTIKNKIDIEAIFYSCQDLVINLVRDKILNNIPIVCCFDSKGYMEKIIKYLQSFSNKDNFLIYSSDNPVDLIETEFWKDKFVFYTPSIMQGVDYNIQETEVFCFVFKYHLNPLQIYQMINRTRKIKNVNIYCHEKEFYNKYKSVDDTIKETEQMLKYFNKLIGDYSVEIDEEPYKVMYNNYRYIDSKLKTNIKYYLMDIMRNKGFTVKENDDIIEEKIVLEKINKEKVVKEIIVKILGLDKDNLTDFERELVSSDKKIEQYFNYKTFVDGKIMFKIKQSIHDNLVLETIQNKYSKILLLKNLMKVLGISKLEDLNKDVCRRFGEVIKDDEWLEDNYEYIKKVFRIRTNKYDNKEYYQLYLLMITLIKQLFGCGVVKETRYKLNYIKYYYFIYKNIYQMEDNIKFID